MSTERKTAWRPQPRVPPAWCTELVPRVARAVRPTARTGFWGNWIGFRRYLGAEGVGNGRRSVQGLHRLAREAPCTTEPQNDAPTRQERMLDDSPRRSDPLLSSLSRSIPTLLAHTFVGRCSALSPPRAPPRFQPHPLRDASRRARKRGRSPPSAVSHRAPANRERTRHPPPPSLHFGGEGSEIRAGNVRAGVLGGRSWWEMPLHALVAAAATPLLPSVPRRS